MAKRLDAPSGHLLRPLAGNSQERIIAQFVRLFPKSGKALESPGGVAEPVTAHHI
jgi:hypothetical protein